MGLHVEVTPYIDLDSVSVVILDKIRKRSASLRVPLFLVMYIFKPNGIPLIYQLDQSIYNLGLLGGYLLFLFKS